MSQAPLSPSPEDERRARGRRNLVIGLALAAFVALVFVITLVRLSGQSLAPT